MGALAVLLITGWASRSPICAGPKLHALQGRSTPPQVEVTAVVSSPG